jgi:hypothetical protein
MELLLWLIGQFAVWIERPPRRQVSHQHVGQLVELESGDGRDRHNIREVAEFTDGS